LAATPQDAVKLHRAAAGRGGALRTAVIAKEGPMTDQRAEPDRERRERRKATEAAERRLEELREAWHRRRKDGERERGRSGHSRGGRPG
jgi:hypothetical protein